MRIKKLIALGMAGATVAAGLWSCSDDDTTSTEQEQTEEQSHTGKVSGITIGEITLDESSLTSTSAKVSASMSQLSAAHKVTFMYGTDEGSLTKSESCMVYSSTFSVTLKNLQANTTYYVQVVMTSSIEDPIYSEVFSFTTPEIVDLSEYTGPAYADDYRSLSSWANSDQWNLANVHDPSVMLADDGYYYMYQTDASFGNAHEGHGHFHARRSQNLVDWEYLGATMTTTPSWVLEKCNEIREAMGLETKITDPQYGWWAPCARKVKDGLYRMYYSIVIDNYIGNGEAASTTFDGTWGERAFIGVMETTNPADNSSWEDKGYVICSSSDKGLNYQRSSTSDWSAYFKFNAIDPSYIIAPTGEHWLIYGSWHSGIAAVQIDPETGKTLETLPNPWGTSDDISAYGKLIYTRDINSRWQGSEGPEVVYHDGYYYLFVAYDALAVPYNTRVVRSKNIGGPYVDINGTDCTKTTSGNTYPIMTHPYRFADDSRGWVGISHCAVFADANDNWYYASQARFPESTTDTWAPNAVMMGHIRRIVWTEDGWPLVMPERYGRVPQKSISTSEIAGTWQNINLAYSYGKQDVGSTMTFESDGSISSGTWKGKTWTFDETSQTLTVSSVGKLYLSRECDWEATNRPATIVYAGFSTNHTTTYWGKKSSE